MFWNPNFWQPMLLSHAGLWLLVAAFVFAMFFAENQDSLKGLLYLFLLEASGFLLLVVVLLGGNLWLDQNNKLYQGQSAYSAEKVFARQAGIDVGEVTITPERCLVKYDKKSRFYCKVWEGRAQFLLDGVEHSEAVTYDDSQDRFVAPIAQLSTSLQE